jgi:hypothetical protein
MDDKGEGWLPFWNPRLLKKCYYEEMKNSYSILARFWVSWLVITLVYIRTMFAESPSYGIIGMFVPFGIWNTPSSFSWRGAITFPLLVVSLFCADWVAAKIHVPDGFVKIVFNLFWLLVLTFAVDYVIYGTWQSLQLVVHF